jgi:hypothetical protein
VLKTFKSKFMKKILLLSLSVLTFVINGCSFFNEPEEEQLTAATNTGSDTFSCRVNGKVWRSYVGLIFGLDDFGVFYNNPRNPTQLILEAERAYDYESVIFIQCDSVHKVGKYKISEAYYKDEKANMYYDELVGENYLTLTHLDTATNIISGTFAFTVKDSNGNLRHITEGRFDGKSPW